MMHSCCGIFHLHLCCFPVSAKEKEALRKKTQRARMTDSDKDVAKEKDRLRKEKKRALEKRAKAPMAPPSFSDTDSVASPQLKRNTSTLTCIVLTF